MADSSAPTASSAASGSQLIDGLLIGRKWAGPITYSAPNSLADYEPGYSTGLGLTGEFNTGHFSGLTAQQLAAFHFTLNISGASTGFSVSGFTNLDVTFISGGSGEGTIRAANMDDANPTAYGFYPHGSAYGGDIFLGNYYDTTSNSLKSPKPGNWAWHTMLHEVGHALGLKHGHESGGIAGALPANVDSLEFTVMTYRTYIGQTPSGYTYEQWGAPQTYMMLDIAALQYLYGADFTVNAGDTVYRWEPGSGKTWIDGQVAISPGGDNIFATIWDGGGTDTYDLSAYSTGVTIDLWPGGGSVFSKPQLAYLGGGPNGGYARANIFNALQYKGDPRSLIENAIAGAGNDLISGNQADNVLTGNGGHDTFNGRSGDDTLKGSTGNDSLRGGLGNDILDGGPGSDTVTYSGLSIPITVNLNVIGPQSSGEGSDTLIGIENVVGGNGSDKLTGNSGNNTLKGNSGHDKLYGQAGNDTLSGDDGNDTLYGGAGSDRLTGGNGRDTLHGEAGNDTLYGGATNDRLTGGNGRDTLYGEAGNDTLYGGASSDRLTGGSGRDTLYGEAGNDMLTGGASKDILIGGADKDRFDFNAISESRKGSNRDKIRDFKRGEDKIDLGGIDANTKKGGNQKFKFIGDDKFSKAPGELRFDNKKVQADVNGDGKADFEIHVDVSKLAAGDFIL